MKHKHYDLIAEWIKDTNKTVQIGCSDGTWISVSKPKWRDDAEYRFKPREFVKGEWYPCVRVCQPEKEGYPMYFDGCDFTDFNGADVLFSISDFSFIGESLGVIKFGGGNE